VIRTKSALAGGLMTMLVALPATAQQAPLDTTLPATGTCSGCFAYLEFSPAIEPESYAVRGQANEPLAPRPASEPSCSSESKLCISFSNEQPASRAPLARIEP
jgi:hypothetical protein